MAAGDVNTGTSWPACFGEEPDNVLVRDVKEASEIVDVESMTETGTIYGGKKKRTRVDVTVVVELLEGGRAEVAALEGEGVAAADDARITKVEFGSDQENQPIATISGHYYNNDQASWKYAAPTP